MIKRAFIRGLWGYLSKEDRQIERKYRVDENIKKIISMDARLQHPFRTYVWGEDNYKQLHDVGLTDLVLVTKEPYQWDLIKYQYRHKLELLKLAMQDYDEIVHMDWDCLPQKPIDDQYWDLFYKKEAIQCNLFQYRNMNCPWRKEDSRKAINGGYMYLRDKGIPDDLIKWWDKYNGRWKQSMEPSTSQYIDDINGGWVGLDNYFNRYEPDSCRLRYFSAYTDRVRPDPYFIHWANVPSNFRGLRCTK